MFKADDSLRRIQDEIGKIAIPPGNAELVPLIEAVRLIAEHLSHVQSDTPAAATADQDNDFYLKTEAPEYAGK